MRFFFSLLLLSPSQLLPSPLASESYRLYAVLFLHSSPPPLSVPSPFGSSPTITPSPPTALPGNRCCSSDRHSTKEAGMGWSVFAGGPFEWGKWCDVGTGEGSSERARDGCGVGVGRLERANREGVNQALGRSVPQLFF